MKNNLVIPLIIILITSFASFAQSDALITDKAELQDLEYPNRTVRQKNPKSYLIQSIPQGATVFLDDKLMGKTPLYVEVYPGYHRIKLIKSGYMILSDTIFLSKKDKVINCTLQRIDDSPQLNSENNSDKPYYWMSNKNQYDTSGSVDNATIYSYIPEGYQANQYRVIEPAIETKHKSRIKTYALVAGATGAVAVWTAIVAHNKYNKYASATDDATTLHKQINTLDVITVSAIVACGVSLTGVMLHSLWLYDGRNKGVRLSIIPLENGAMVSANIKF